FITEDSYRGELVDPQSQNVYIYVMNNPIKYVDPTGHNAELLDELNSWAEDNPYYLAQYTPKNVNILIGSPVLNEFDESHDLNPENFVDSALVLVEAYKNNSNITVYIDQEAYKRRVEATQTQDIINRFSNLGASVKNYDTTEDLFSMLNNESNVDEFHYFGHAESRRLLLTFNQSKRNIKYFDEFTTADIGKLSLSNMFNQKAKTVFWTCNAAATQYYGKENTFAYKWARTFSVNTYALDVQMSYATNRGIFAGNPGTIDYDEVAGLPGYTEQGKHWVSISPAGKKKGVYNTNEFFSSYFGNSYGNQLLPNGIALKSDWWKLIHSMGRNLYHPETPEF
ncbi:MAG: hypothetical protein ACOCRK_07620, partial [bacterium]